MSFKKGFLLVVFALMVTTVNAQYFLFSEDPETFPTEVINSLNRIDTESARKVASDFRSVWERDLNQEQKDQVMRIAKTMKDRNLRLRPFFEYYFSYITYSIKQASISKKNLDEILKINEDAAKTSNLKEYHKFLLTLNLFFAREYIYFTRFNYVKAIGGSYEFETVDIAGGAATFQVDTASLVTDDFEDDTAWTDDSDTTSWYADDDSSEEIVWMDDDASWDDDSSWDDSYDDTFVEELPERELVAPAGRDYVAELTAKFQPPGISGPVMKLKSTDILMVTKYDSMTIKGTNGTYELKGKTFLGNGGKAGWPGELKSMSGAEVSFGEYYFDVGKSELWTPYAKLSFPQFLNKEVEGVFRYKSVPTRLKDRANKNYPYFESMQSDVEVDLPFQGVSYTGGIAFQGQKMYGKSISRNIGTLTVRDGKGRKIIAKAQEFSFVDSLITSKNATVYIIHKNDTIYNPSVSFSYSPDSKQLILSKSNNPDFKNAPYYSTFHLMDIYTDRVAWDMNTDSLDLSIESARNLVPTIMMSEDYFSPDIFRRYATGLGFHPVIIAVNYARKYGIQKFYIDELMAEYNLNEAKGKETAKILKREGFAEYDPITRLVKLKEKAFHSWESNFKKRDYDHLLISSVLNSAPNATIHLDDDELIVRGVKEFYLSKDKELMIRPDSGVISLSSNRNIKFNGMVKAGDFRYKGKDFEFDYDQFLVTMPSIDSIQIQITIIDSTTEESSRKPQKEALRNHINQTSGTLYLNSPSNKSGNDELFSYPYFNSDSEAVVYFDSPDYLNGAYDKSIKFIVPPFEIDSIDKQSQNAISFKGRFESGGIFPTFEEELVIMPDKSLGFIHDVPDDGYVLYRSGAKLYNNIQLDGQGIHSSGELDYITTRVNSEDFTFYMDSVTAIGTDGVIKEGDKYGASYPQAELSRYRMKWLPRKDSMYLRSIGDPFQFYNRTATLNGEANVTKKGVFGSGTLLTRGSRSESKDLSFKQFSYSARNADFEVLSDNPSKPAMKGEDISLEFDLLSNTADISPEQAGVASLSFPYAQMKTSLSEAFWDLEDSVVTMLKSPNVDILNSYFYSTKPELDSLAFSAAQASYDINTFELQIAGIPYIIVADAKITPENGETTILKDSELLPFNNAEIVIDTLNEYHYLFNGNIKILSRKSFQGDATYKLVNAEEDSFNIKFESFELEEVPIGKKETKLMTVSGGEILESDKVEVSAGFKYKGSVTMYAYKEPLELDGLVQLETSSFGSDYNKWIRYQRNGEENAVVIDFETAVYEEGDPVNAGLHFDIRGNLYPSLLGDRRDISDIDFFTPKGEIRYDLDNTYYQIETPSKTKGETYQGSTFIFDDKTQDIIFEGLVEFSKSQNKGFEMRTSVLGTGNSKDESYSMDIMSLINYDIHPSIPDLMALDFVDLLDRIGLAPAHDNSIQLMYKLANLVGDESTKDYEEKSLKNYTPLVDADRGLPVTLGISNLKMEWSNKEKSWYNTSKIGLSHIGRTDINAKMNGFVEIKKSESEQDIINIFLQPSAGTWYFLGYEDHHLFLLSSNEEFNNAVVDKSNSNKSKIGELVYLNAELNEVLEFIDNFRLVHLGITEPYDLQVPGEIGLEDDENFDTIEKVEDEDDDGFGF